MVGFGSSLRMARRPGWEGAYADYETLKLMLSQIEAVYEEGGPNNQHNNNFFVDTSSANNNKRKQQRKRRRDYRDELFLESDSDQAYLSVDDKRRAAMNNIENPEEEIRVGYHHHPENTAMRSSMNEEQQQSLTPGRQFTLHYSREQSSSSEEEADEPGCATAMASMLWATKKKAPETDDASTKKRHRSNVNNAFSTTIMSEEEEDRYYSRSAGGGSNAFILRSADEEDADEDDTFEQQPSRGARRESQEQPSFLNAPVRHSYNYESTSAMAPGSSLFSFAAAEGSSKALTPPSHHYTKATVEADAVSGFSTPLSVPALTTTTKATTADLQQKKRFQLQQKLSRERKHERKLRRLRQKQRKVPHHLRVAHAKARAITERFLGFLRAETEKVMLFAQSRLGELADTAGSLRFPSFEDEYHGGTSRRQNHYSEYPLSDGGLHPSASSSSDEGGGTGPFQGIYPWSDTSDEEQGENVTQEGLTTAGVSDDQLLLRGSSNRRKQPRPSPPVASSRKKSTAVAVAGVSSSSAAEAGTATTSTTESRKTQRESISAIRRQIKHFTTLRQNRGTFQRSDQILGEDMLFLSAVEEADGYTAVGVELMHVLRYICVNLIAIRKICRKHDRLLMNRMLGGYYQRAKASNFEGRETLGGLLAGVAGDVYDAHPALIGQWNHFKLVGVYDRKIQQLANSRTVQVVSSCLALALSEYEISRSRENALTGLNSKTSFPTPKRSGGGLALHRDTEMGLEADEIRSIGGNDAPSTASEISLTRLQYTVASIHALREAAREKQTPFLNYLSRSCLAFSGQAVIGEGLDGCSRETLDFLVSYDPDAAILLDSAILFDGLKHGRWNETPMRDLMLSAIATSTTPENVSEQAAVQMLPNEEAVLEYAISLNPTVPRGKFPRLKESSLSAPTQTEGDFTPTLLLINRTTSFLYMTNYFVLHATSDLFVTTTGASPVYTACIIGAPNLTSIIVSALHCIVLSRSSQSGNRYNFGTFRCFFILSALWAAVGNAVHARGIDIGSIPLAVVGRLIFGLSSTEILQRQALHSCLPSHIVSASARLAILQVAGVATGLLLGAFVNAIQITLEAYGVRSLQSTSWLMMACWLVHCVRLLIQFRSGWEENDVAAPADQSISRNPTPEMLAEGFSDAHSDSSSSEDTEDRRDPSRLFASAGNSDVTNLTSTYGSIMKEGSPGTQASRTDEIIPLRRTGSGVGEPVAKKRGFRRVRVFAGRVRKLLAYHVGIPVSMFIVVFVTFSTEAFFTSTPMLTHRYFGWSGAHACLFLGCLALSIVPIHSACERIARRFEERTVIKRSLQVVMIGLFAMFNWVSAFSLASRFPSLLSDMDERQQHHPYDWHLGVIQYVAGFTMVFVGLTAMGGASLSLLSKVSPAHLRSVVIQVATLTTFLTMAARLAADIQVLMIGLSHKLINADIVNALAVPLFLISFVVAIVVKQNYFFLL